MAFLRLAVQGLHELRVHRGMNHVFPVILHVRPFMTVANGSELEMLTKSLKINETVCLENFVMLIFL